MKRQLFLCLLMLLVSLPLGTASAQDSFYESVDETPIRLQSLEENDLSDRAPRTRAPAPAASGRQQPATARPAAQQPGTTSVAPTSRTATQTRVRTQRAPQPAVITAPRPAETSPGPQTSTRVERRGILQWDTQPPSKPAQSPAAHPVTDGKPVTERPQWGKPAEKSSLLLPGPKQGVSIVE